MSDQEPLHGSVFNPSQVRTLKIVVIVMTILLVLGFALLIAGLYYQASKIGEDRAAAPAPTVQLDAAGGELSVRVPAGAQVQQIMAEGGRVILHLKGPGAEEIVVLDTTRGNAVTRMRLSPR